MGAIKLLLLVAVLSLTTIASALPTNGVAEVGPPDDGAVDVTWPTEAAPALSRSTSSDGPGLAQIMRRRKVCRYPRCGFKPIKVIARVQYPCFFKRSRKTFIATKRTCGRKPFACKPSACKRWKVCTCLRCKTVIIRVRKWCLKKTA